MLQKLKLGPVFFLLLSPSSCWDQMSQYILLPGSLLQQKVIAKFEHFDDQERKEERKTKQANSKKTQGKEGRKEEEKETKE